MFETGTDLVRPAGAGAGQMFMASNRNGGNGFSAFGGPVRICFGTLASPTALVWGGTNFTLGDTLILNHSTADNTLDFRNPVNLGNSARRVAVNASNTAAVATMSGVLSGTGGGVTKIGVGMLALTGANTYTGNTTVSAGTLRIGGSGTLGNVSAGVGDYAGSISIASTNNGRLVFNSSATQTLGGVISGAGALFVEAGSLSVTGTNTYTGSTTVTAGTLAVGPAGTINLTSDVLVTGGTFRYDNSTTPLNPTVAFGGTGGTISGVGRIATDLVISSGNTISPGNSPGILGTGNLTWAAGGNYNWQVFDAELASGTGFDQLSITGSLTVESGFNLNLWSQDMVSDVIFNGDAIFDENVNQHWVIATTTGGLIGAENLATTSIFTDSRNGTTGFTNELVPGASFSLVQGGGLSGTTNSDVVLVYAVPEPATVVLLAGGALAGLLASRARAGRRILAGRGGRGGAARQ